MHACGISFLVVLCIHVTIGVALHNLYITVCFCVKLKLHVYSISVTFNAIPERTTEFQELFFFYALPAFTFAILIMIEMRVIL